VTGTKRSGGAQCGEVAEEARVGALQPQLPAPTLVCARRRPLAREATPPPPSWGYARGRDTLDPRPPRAPVARVAVLALSPSGALPFVLFSQTRNGGSPRLLIQTRSSLPFRYSGELLGRDPPALSIELMLVALDANRARSKGQDGRQRAVAKVPLRTAEVPPGRIPNDRQEPSAPHRPPLQHESPPRPGLTGPRAPRAMSSGRAESRTLYISVLS
jgi:hypothetical protein